MKYLFHIPPKGSVVKIEYPSRLRGVALQQVVHRALETVLRLLNYTLTLDTPGLLGSRSTLASIQSTPGTMPLSQIKALALHCRSQDSSTLGVSLSRYSHHVPVAHSLKIQNHLCCKTVAAEICTRQEIEFVLGYSSSHRNRGHVDKSSESFTVICSKGRR